MSVDLKTKEDIQVKLPKQYKVLLHNDNYTPREFVVFILENVFYFSSTKSVNLILQVERDGVGVVGVYSYEVAESKIQQVKELTERYEYPLLCTMEEE